MDCWKEEKQLYIKPKTVLHETIWNFCGNFVAPKSVANFQLRNHCLEVIDPAEEDEKEMRRVIDDSALRTQCLKLTGWRWKHDVMGRERGGSLTIKVLHSIIKRKAAGCAIQVVLYKRAWISTRRHFNEECGILAPIHAVVEWEHLIFLSGETAKILHAYF